MTSSDVQQCVLIVDDDDPTRMMANEFLSQAGFEVLEAASGHEALETLKSRKPHIILLDVEMPEVDGFDTCKNIRALSEFVTTPILMLTGLNNNASIELAFEAGATDFASKPINWSLLCHRMRYMLRAWQAAYQLEKNQRSLASAQRIAQLGNWEWDAQSGSMDWSDHLYAIFECDKAAVEPSMDSLLGFVHNNDRARVKNWLSMMQKRGETSESIDFCLISGAGKERHVRQQVERVTSLEGDVVQLQAVMQDFSERRLAENRIAQLAYYDEVTGLANRALFSERVDEAVVLAKHQDSSVAILYIDVHDFKHVNDTLGHSAGDIMLNDIAERISACVRSGPSADSIISGGCNTIVSRMGADEFTVMLAGIPKTSDVSRVANRMLESLSLPYELQGGEIISSSNIGIATYPQHGENGEAIIKNAAMAMTVANRVEKNGFCLYDENMDMEAQKRFRIESQMRHALERNEFSLHYQPQIDLATGKVFAAEALVRWHSPELGFVSPGDFIHIAEDNGFIVPLGEWVLRTACEQAKVWLDEGFPFSRVAVNISVLQFIRADFPETLRTVLQETGLDPDYLELEITESLLASDTSGAVETLRTLKSIGVQLSIDDFGTGYSSLSQLKHFPIDRLKLDQSFTQGVTDSKQDAAITRAVIAMAASMDIRLLAEGVETIDQLDFLIEHGCHEIQGYYISKPQTAESLAKDMPQILYKLNDLFDESGQWRKAA